MMEIENLIKHMRKEAQDYRAGRTLGRAFADAEDVLDEAATALEQLQAENERLKKERDDAIRQLKFFAPCASCGGTHMEKQNYSISAISKLFTGVDGHDLRLTVKGLDLCEVCTNGLQCRVFFDPCGAKLVYSKLAQYEDSGLTPEEVRQMRWIPVEERKPASSDNPILIYKAVNDRNNNIGTAWYSPYHGWIPTNGTKIYGISHWMPLPKPPKEEKP